LEPAHFVLFIIKLVEMVGVEPTSESDIKKISFYTLHLHYCSRFYPAAIQRPRVKN